LSNNQPSRLPRRSANGSVLASALITRILGYFVTFFKQNGFLNRPPESSFRNEFYLNIFGAFLIRIFFFWFCTHLWVGLLVFREEHKSKRPRVAWNDSEYESQLIHAESRAFYR
jgi:hypothetical protein